MLYWRPTDAGHWFHCDQPWSSSASPPARARATPCRRVKSPSQPLSSPTGTPPPTERPLAPSSPSNIESGLRPQNVRHSTTQHRRRHESRPPGTSRLPALDAHSGPRPSLPAFSGLPHHHAAARVWHRDLACFALAKADPSKRRHSRLETSCVKHDYYSLLSPRVLGLASASSSFPSSPCFSHNN